MRINIRNKAGLSKRYLRFLKGKIQSTAEKFQHLLYVTIFLNAEGKSHKEYRVNIRLGIRGNDIIIQNKSTDLGKITRKSLGAVNRYLIKSK